MAKRKVLSLVLVLTLVLTVMAGCGSKPAPQSAPQSSAPSAPQSQQAKKIDWPKSAIQVLVPSKPGGLTDLHARYVTNWWQKAINNSVAVVNYDNTNVAYENLIKAKPDGSSIMYQHNGIVVSYYTGGINFNPAQEMTVIAALQYTGDQAIIAPPNAPFNTFAEMVQYAKAHPGELSAGVAMGSTTHVIWGSIMQQAGIKLKLVQAASETDKLTNVAGGFIDLGNVSLNNAKQYEDAKKVKVLGLLTADDKPNADFPQWKPVAAQGVNVTWSSNIYVFGPKGMDADLVNKINESFKGVVNDPEVIKNFKGMGARPEWHNVADSQALFKSDMDKMAKVTTDLGINKVK